ncbi:MAG: RIP metalloprotease RseP, partial [Bacteroidota bacterium]
AKPTWQRLIIMVGGVTVNLFLGFFIYSMVLFTWGKDLLPNESMVHGMYADTLLHQYGFEDGDRILKLDTNSIRYFGDINAALLINGVREVTVERNGSQQTIPLPDTFAEVLLDSGVKVPLIPRIPWVIESTVAERPAAKAGLLAGDKIVAINGAATPYFVEVRKAIRSSAGQTIEVTVERAGANQTISVAVDTGGGIGIYRLSALDVLESEHRDYTLAESIPAGFTESIAKLTSYVRSMKLLFTKAGAKQIGGFGAIGSMFPAEWIWQDFWQFTAFLSLILAFMNILPIPALDGGHVMFLLYEMITGRPPGEKFLEYAQIAGMILLIALLLYANGNDIYRWLSQ